MISQPKCNKDIKVHDLTLSPAVVTELAVPERGGSRPLPSGSRTALCPASGAWRTCGRGQGEGATPLWQVPGRRRWSTPASPPSWTLQASTHTGIKPRTFRLVKSTNSNLCIGQNSQDRNRQGKATLFIQHFSNTRQTWSALDINIVVQLSNNTFIFTSHTSHLRVILSYNTYI